MAHSTLVVAGIGGATPTETDPSIYMVMIVHVVVNKKSTDPTFRKKTTFSVSGPLAETGAFRQ